MASKSTTAPRTAAPSQPSSAAITLDAVRSKLIAGQSVSPGEFASAKASVEMDEMIADLAGQRQAAAEAADLEHRRETVTDQALSNALLAQGAVAPATDRLKELVSEALSEFLRTTDAINSAIHTTAYATRELDMVDDPSRPVYYRTAGPHSGLVVNGVRIEPLASWQRVAEGVLIKALAQARREHR